MDTNDFVFTDDFVESLGFRADEADHLSAEPADSDASAGTVKAALASFGGIGVGILSFMQFLDR